MSISNAVPPDPLSPQAPLSPDMFKANFEVKLVRFELYPVEEPTCYVVGFSSTNKANGKTRYMDTQVSFTSIMSDGDIVSAGWGQLRDPFLSWAGTANGVTATLLNSQFTPTF